MDILKDILTLCKDKGMKKTKIAYSSNLNFQKASEYLDWLVVHELVKKEKEQYRITSAGSMLLDNLGGITHKP